MVEKRAVHKVSMQPLLRALAFLSACFSSAILASCFASRVPDRALEDYARARDAYATGDLESAGALAAQAIAESRGFHQAEFLQGKIAFFNGDLARAERVFRALIGRYRSYNDAEIWLVRTLIEESRSTEAEARLEELLARDGGDPRLLHLMGTIRRDRDDLEGALAFYERAAAFSEELARSELERARIHHVYGQRERALAEVDRSLALLPEGSALRGAVSALRNAIVNGRSP